MAELLRLKASSRVKKRDLVPGFTYLMQDLDEPLVKKIGMTRRSPEKRRAALMSKCGKKLRVVRSIFMEQGCEMLETLIQIELFLYRMKHNRCQKCGKEHLEYFRVPLHTVEKIFDRWEHILSQAPYQDKDGRLLEHDWKFRLGDLCDEFLEAGSFDKTSFMKVWDRFVDLDAVA
jgi:hypothetical protein